MRRTGWRADRCVVDSHGLWPGSPRNLLKLVIFGGGVRREVIVVATGHLCVFVGCHGLGSHDTYGIYVQGSREKLAGPP